MLEFETRGRFTNDESKLGIMIGNIFYGTEGYLELNGSTWKAYKNREKVPFEVSPAENSEVPTDPTFRAAPGGSEHFANFIDAIRSGNDGDLNCDILDGHFSAALPHLANISYRLGRELHFMESYEKFANDPEADLMLTRNYRRPYVVPEEV